MSKQEDEINQLKSRLEKIELRNKRVESDKLWETSWQRRLSILILTYLFVTLYFSLINLPKPFINAVVPTLGFYLSTLTLGYLKAHWIRRNNENS
jgi:polyferredoxin